MAFEHIALEEKDGISVIRMNRPPANAFTLEFAEQFEAAYDEVMRADPRAVLLTGTGNFFSGGLDLRVIPNYSPGEQRAFLQILNRLIGRIYACPRPFVAGVNGHSIAGAFVLTLSADYRIGPQGDYQFGLTEARVGIPFPAVPAVVVSAELSAPNVRYATLYAKNFGPDEAVRRGVFDELQPPESVFDRAVEVAKDLASMPADSYARIKHQFRADAIAKITELNVEQSDPMLDSWVSDDASEASNGLLDAAR